MSQEKAKRAPLTQVEQRMAFYAKLLKDGQLTLSDEDAEEWRRDLPAAIRAQHSILDRGGLPVAMTLANVRRLKTLALKNAYGIRPLRWNSLVYTSGSTGWL